MDYLTLLIVILILAVMAIIGYLAEKEGFGRSEIDGEPRTNLDSEEKAKAKEAAKEKARLEKEEKERLREEERCKAQLEKDAAKAEKAAAKEQTRLEGDAEKEVAAMPFEEVETLAFDVAIPVETLSFDSVAPVETIDFEEPVVEVFNETPVTEEDIFKNDYTSDLGIFGETLTADSAVVETPAEELEIEEIFHFEEVPVHEDIMTGMEFTTEQQDTLNEEVALSTDMTVEPVKSDVEIDDVWKF